MIEAYILTGFLASLYYKAPAMTTDYPLLECYKRATLFMIAWPLMIIGGK